MMRGDLGKFPGIGGFVGIGMSTDSAELIEDEVTQPDNRDVPSVDNDVSAMEDIVKCAESQSKIEQ